MRFPLSKQPTPLHQVAESDIVALELLEAGSMGTDTEIKTKGFQALVESLGQVEAERFIAPIMREPFDYAKWQRSLLTDKTVSEISSSATRFRREAGLSEEKQ
jgi:hypothetical protein